MKYLIDAQAFLNVLPFVCINHPRTQAVQIRSNYICSTNDHMAIFHKLKQMNTSNLPDGFSPIELSTIFLIKVEDVKRVTAFIKGLIKSTPRGVEAYIAYDTETFALSDMRGSMTYTAGLYDYGNFPDLLKVIPKPESLQPVSHLNISGGYIGQLAALVGKGGKGMIEIYGTGGLLEPIIIRPYSGAWLAVVMPCKLSKDEVAAKKAMEDLHAALKGEARPARLTEGD